jgi:hypothetical protein
MIIGTIFPEWIFSFFIFHGNGLPDEKSVLSLFNDLQSLKFLIELNHQSQSILLDYICHLTSVDPGIMISTKPVAINFHPKGRDSDVMDRLQMKVPVSLMISKSEDNIDE